MRAAATHLDITPAGPHHLGGYRHPSRRGAAAGVHDPVEADALLVEHDGREFFVVSLDLVEIEEGFADDLKTRLADAAGLDRDLVHVIATHDHSSTSVYFEHWWTGHGDAGARAQLLDRLVAAHATCRAQLREATVRVGRTTVVGHYGNRNHPGEPADNEVVVVHFVDATGTPFCGIVNWAVHSTVLPGTNDLLTADLAGAVRRHLAEVHGFTSLMMVGAAGDCSNRHQRQGQDFAELDRVSAAVAAQIARVVPDEPVPGGPVHVQTLFHTVHADGFHLDAKGWVVDLGGLRLFVFPGELGSAFGPQLRASHPGPSLVCGYANGYYAYWMPAAEYGLSFETTSSRVPVGEPEKLVAKFTRVPAPPA